jgi:hypothetical protein
LLRQQPACITLLPLLWLGQAVEQQRCLQQTARPPVARLVWSWRQALLCGRMATHPASVSIFQ